MKEEERKKEIDKRFDKLAKDTFPNPEECTLNETRAFISELNKVITHFERKFNYIPSSAHLLFDKYNHKQEQILFDQYLNEYGSLSSSNEDEANSSSE